MTDINDRLFTGHIDIVEKQELLIIVFKHFIRHTGTWIFNLSVLI